MMNVDTKDVSKEAAAINAGDTIDRFLNDETVKKAISSLEHGYLAEFKLSTTSEQRELIFARVSVLGDLQRALRAVVDNGKVVKDRVEHREKLEAQNRPARPR
jgi:hypothetical protein